MDRRTKLRFLTFLTTFFFVAVAYAQSYMLLPIVSVYDGDTIKTRMSRLPAPLDRISIRINGIDTPERGWRAKCAKEALLAEQAKDALEDLIHQTEATVMKVENFRYGKYGGRILADVKIGGIDVAQYLISRGFAIEYDGGKKTHDWCQ